MNSKEIKLDQNVNQVEEVEKLLESSKLINSPLVNQNELEVKRLEDENTYLKKMLNDFLDGVYRYRDSEFDDLRVRD